MYIYLVTYKGSNPSAQLKRTNESRERAISSTAQWCFGRTPRPRLVYFERKRGRHKSPYEGVFVFKPGDTAYRLRTKEGDIIFIAYPGTVQETVEMIRDIIITDKRIKHTIVGPLPEDQGYVPRINLENTPYQVVAYAPRTVSVNVLSEDLQAAIRAEFSGENVRLVGDFEEVYTETNGARTVIQAITAALPAKDFVNYVKGGSGIVVTAGGEVVWQEQFDEPVNGREIKVSVGE